MKHSRHRARECALQILYKLDVEQDSNPSSATLETHFKHFDVAQQTRDFTKELVIGTLKNISTLDQLIEKSSSNWKMNRMAVIDRNLIRMALFELNHMSEETPFSVTLDEAVELAKSFGSAESPSFVNAILDNMRKKK